jgi:hypothetical protein
MVLCVVINTLLIIFSKYLQNLIFVKTQEQGSSVSRVSDYGLDGRGSNPDTGRRYFL